MEALEWLYSAATSIYGESQLSTELDRLRASLPKARMLICRSEWGMFKNKELAKLLSRLKDTTYDAEDLLRELDDEALRLRIEDAERSRAGQLLSSSLNNIARVFVRRSKTRIQEAQAKLDTAVAQIEGVLNLMGLMSVEPSQIMPETSSVISASEVVGRDGERDALIEMLGVTLGREAQRDQVIELLGVPLAGGRTRHAVSKGKRAAASSGATSSRAKQPRGSSGRPGFSSSSSQVTNITDNVSVVSIVGIGGVGKTTLAQFIYNDPRVQHHFGAMIWVCVSDFFDKTRITMEIFQCIPTVEGNPSSCIPDAQQFNPSRCSLNAVQVELTKRLKKCPKFLLVLDDVWPNANVHWEEFYGPLRHGPEGSMILVTTRCPVVANRVTTSNHEPIQLHGLPTDVFWEFFKKCAFGTNDPESYPHLQDIGQSISTKLCGSPLAAKTLGRLLNMSLTERHWMMIQKSELWELRHDENEILPALQLSYLYLPEEVKRCFVFCSMFPKDYSFERDEIVNIWVAEGFIAPGGSMHAEDVGISYLDELRNRFLFQNDPKFPNKSRYVMHDLIHDMAMSFSMDESLVVQDLTDWHKSGMHNNAVLRHMSIEVDGESLITRMGDIQHLNKLHSLRFAIKLNGEINWFSHLSNILFLSLKGCYLEKLPKSICELSSLRYLDISHSNIRELPEKLWRLYSLQFLDASHSILNGVHQDVTKLINLRQLAVPELASEALSKVSGLGTLSCLRNLSCLTVAKENGRGIGELKFMNQLSGSLCIRGLACVGSEGEAAEARLVEKEYLKELVLQWKWGCSSTLKRSENAVLQGLRPHPRTECLKVCCFSGDRFPSWFRPQDLPSLRSLELVNCDHLESLSILGFAEGAVQTGSTGDHGTQQAARGSSNNTASFSFTRLTCLRVFRCCRLTNLEYFLTPEKLPSIESILLEECDNAASISAHSFVGFTRLRDLKIFCCPKLQCPWGMVLPPSLRRLCIVGCNELGRSFLPTCLENHTSLTLLQLAFCDNIKCIPLKSIGSNMLKCLVISDCEELSSIGGFHGLESIPHVQLSGCPKLTEVLLPFEKKELQAKDGEELLKFLYPNSMLVRARFQLQRY